MKWYNNLLVSLLIFPIVPLSIGILILCLSNLTSYIPVLFSILIGFISLDLFLGCTIDKSFGDVLDKLEYGTDNWKRIQEHEKYWS